MLSRERTSLSLVVCLLMAAFLGIGAKVKNRALLFATSSPGGVSTTALTTFGKQQCAFKLLRETNCLTATMIDAGNGKYTCTCLVVLRRSVELAQGKPCTSSSVFGGSNDAAGCDHAVDGSPKTRWFAYSCFGTQKYDPDPWWQVDLQAAYTVTSVAVHLRSDCCRDRFDHVNIFVGTSAEKKESGAPCHIGIRSNSDGVREFPCTGLAIGRFVFFQNKTPSGRLEMCEVKVFGY